MPDSRTMPGQLKVLMVLISYSIGGAEKRYTNLFNFLSTHGKYSYKLIINRTLHQLLTDAGIKFNRPENIHLVGLTLNRLGADLQEGIGKGFSNFWAKIIHAIGWRLNKVLIEKQVRKMMAVWKPDIIHGILKGVNLVDHVPHRKIVKVMSYVHSEDKIPQYQSRALGRADALDILAENMKNSLSLNGIVCKNMKVAPCSFTDYSRTYLGKKGRNVIFLARLESMKHPEMFIQMIELIPDELRNSSYFMMLGTGSLNRSIQKMAKPFVDQKILDLKGYVANPIPFLAEGLIFVQTTACESHGTQSLLEAMACGNAVVTTDLPGIEKIISDDVGFRVAHDPEAFADRVSFLLRNFELAEQMGQRAREKAMQTQNVENYAIHMEELYQKVYEEKNPRLNLCAHRL